MVAAERAHSEAIIVYKDNKLLIEKYFGIGSSDNIIETMSCTKSIVGLSIGCLISDGVISNLDIPLNEFYPELNSSDKGKITIRQICNMTSGLQDNQTTEEIYKSGDFIKFAINASQSQPPGQIWRYNNKAVNLLAGVIYKLTNKRMDLYISDRLFKPLEIYDYSWAIDESGNPHVMSGCAIRPIDFAKVGLLVLNKGVYNNTQIMAPSAIDTIFKPSKAFKGYANLWWLNYERVVSIIDDSVINVFKRAHLPDTFIKKVLLLKGSYDNEFDYLNKVETIFGENAWLKISNILQPKSLRLSRKEYIGNATYVANGFLGNYLIISQKKNIVAVRMISSVSHQSSMDDFAEFEKLVLDLGE